MTGTILEFGGGSEAVQRQGARPGGGGGTGELWVGTEGGLDQLVDRKVVERHTTSDGLGPTTARPTGTK